MSGDVRHLQSLGTVAGLCGVLLLGACSSGDPIDGDDAATEALAVDAAQASADETELAADALHGASYALSVNERTVHSTGIGALYVPRALCATVSSTADSDGDGVRDNSTYTYALPACSFEGWRGGTVELTGSIAISDPDPAPSFAYQLTYDDFQWKYTSPNRLNSWSATRNGSRRLTATASQLTLSNQVSIVRTFAIRADATVSQNTQLAYTPDTGSSLTVGQPLPSGTAVKSGQVTISRNAVVRSFTVNTITPLRFDATCATAPRITAGEIHYELTSGGYAKVTWSGCGVLPVVEWVAPAV
jgi:hypothetical protein